jgi:general secretion pathway protein I
VRRRTAAPEFRASPNAGFTLLEVIVATALMGIAVVGLLSLVSQSVGNAARVRQYDRAAMLARTQMDALLTMTPLPVGRRLEGDFDSASGWEAVAEPWEVPGGAQPGASMLVRIALTVWWRAEGRRHTVALDGFRRVRIAAQ